MCEKYFNTTVQNTVHHDRQYIVNAIVHNAIYCTSRNHRKSVTFQI